MCCLFGLFLLCLSWNVFGMFLLKLLRFKGLAVVIKHIVVILFSESSIIIVKKASCWHISFITNFVYAILIIIFLLYRIIFVLNLIEYLKCHILLCLNVLWKLNFKIWFMRVVTYNIVFPQAHRTWTHTNRCQNEAIMTH